MNRELYRKGKCNRVGNLELVTRLFNVVKAVELVVFVSNNTMFNCNKAYLILMVCPVAKTKHDRAI